MVAQRIAYEGRLRCRAEHGPSGASLITDAPKDNAGEGASFSPTDLLVTALATCMATTMGIAARRAGFELGAVELDAEKHMHPQPPRRIARAVIAMRIHGSYTPEQRALLEAAAHGCPVARSVHPDLVQDVRFTWVGESS